MSDTDDGAWSKGRPALIYGSETATPEGFARPVLVDQYGHLIVSGGAAHGDAPVGNAVLVASKSTALEQLVSEGDASNLSSDLYGRIRVRVDAATSSVTIDSPATVSHSGGATGNAADTDGALVLKASAGVLLAAEAVLATSPAADRWLMVFNKSTTPANGDVPIWRAYVGASNSDGLHGGVHFTWPLPCSTGISLGWSSTCATLTLAASEVFFNYEYR